MINKKILKEALEYLKQRCQTLEQTKELLDVFPEDQFLHLGEVEPVLLMLINGEFEDFIEEMKRIGAFNPKD